MRCGVLPTGFSLVDLLAAITLFAILTGISAPLLLATLDDLRAFAATRYLSSRLQQARMEAVSRTANVAVRFERDNLGYVYAVYLDGNRNGVLSRDIQTGVDRELERPRRLSEGFSGVEFAALPGLPPVDPSTPPPGDDPVHLGPSGLATFTPRGTSTPGSLYVRGAGRAQYVVRIFGETGKTRILKYDPHGQRWLPR
jgi:type II secretory pathway pseudopilin PulG